MSAQRALNDAVSNAINTATKATRNSGPTQFRLIAVLDTVLRNLYVPEKDISKVMNIVYTNINRRNLDVALGTDRQCPHGYTPSNCKICNDTYDYYDFYQKRPDNRTD